MTLAFTVHDPASLSRLFLPLRVSADSVADDHHFSSRLVGLPTCKTFVRANSFQAYSQSCETLGVVLLELHRAAQKKLGVYIVRISNFSHARRNYTTCTYLHSTSTCAQSG